MIPICARSLIASPALPPRRARRENQAATGDGNRSGSGDEAVGHREALRQQLLLGGEVDDLELDLGRRVRQGAQRRAVARVAPPPMQRVLAVRTQVRTSAPARSFLGVIAPANQSACACRPRVNIGETRTVLPAGRLAETRRA